MVVKSGSFSQPTCLNLGSCTKQTAGLGLLRGLFQGPPWGLALRMACLQTQGPFSHSLPEACTALVPSYLAGRWVCP